MKINTKERCVKEESLSDIDWRKKMEIFMPFCHIQFKSSSKIACEVMLFRKIVEYFLVYLDL